MQMPGWEWVDGDPPTEAPPRDGLNWQALVGVLSTQPGRWLRVTEGRVPVRLRSMMAKAGVEVVRTHGVFYLRLPAEGADLV